MNLRRRCGRCTRPQTLIALILAAIFANLAACTTATVTPIPTEVPAKQWEAGELIHSLAQRREQFRSVRALARVDYSGPEGKSGFEEAILVQRPDQLRLETLTMLGAILIVTVNDKEIVGYHPREGVFLRGQRSKENLLRYTQIPLELDEITALLLGLPPVGAGALWQQAGNSMIFTSAGGRKDVVGFESNQAVPTKWERVNGGGAVELSAKFSDYIATAPGFFPSKIHVESLAQGKRLEIRYQEPELNVALPSELFSQQKPANVQEYPIEALGK